MSNSANTIRQRSNDADHRKRFHSLPCLRVLHYLWGESDVSAGSVLLCMEVEKCGALTIRPYRK